MKEFKPEIFHMNPKDLTPYANNSKQHSTEQIDEIAGQISRFGFDQPIVIDNFHVIIKGHGRREAALRLGLKTVPVIVQNLNEYESMAARIADNKIASKSGFDMDKIKFDFGTLERNKFDLKFTGFSSEEIKGFIDAVPEFRPPTLSVPETSRESEPEPVKSIDSTSSQFKENPADEEIPEIKKTSIKIGTVIELGRHRLVCGDSTNDDMVRLLTGGEKIEFVFTDPPYGMNLDTDYTKMNGNMDGRETKRINHKKVIGDNEDFSPELIKTVFRNFPKAKEIFLFGADYFAEHLPNKNEGSWIVWDKTTTEERDKGFGSSFELCWSMKRHKRTFARIWWQGFFGVKDDQKRVHPTQKPVQLAEFFITRWGAQYTNVCDLYGGVGFTLIACERLGKNAFVMELDPEYCEIICQRWEKMTNEKRKIISL